MPMHDDKNKVPKKIRKNNNEGYKYDIKQNNKQKCTIGCLPTVGETMLLMLIKRPQDT